ncbi:MAG: MBL fold metallo-hydrolase [Acidobacteriaceae bacterium]
MMKMTVLASGSKGNSTVIASSKTRVLVDAGLSCRELMKRMRAAGEDPEALDAILVTHEHIDHVNGLSVMARKLGIPVFFTEPTHRAWVRMQTPRKSMTYAQWLEVRRKEREAKVQGTGNREQEISTLAASAEDAEEKPDLTEASLEPQPAEVEEPEEESKPSAAVHLAQLPAVEYFQAGGRFCVGDIEVSSFTIPHDAADPVGFVFEAEGIRMAMATDLGYMPPNVKLALRKCDVLLLESNHDLEMLRDGPYPWSVKQRVLSRVGHLSNDAVAEFLSGEYDGSASYVVLAHLSESNNLPELARVAAEQALEGRMRLLANQLLLAQQSAPLDSILL